MSAVIDHHQATSHLEFDLNLPVVERGNHVTIFDARTLDRAGIARTLQAIARLMIEDQEETLCYYTDDMIGDFNEISQDQFLNEPMEAGEYLIGVSIPGDALILVGVVFDEHLLMGSNPGPLPQINVHNHSGH